MTRPRIIVADDNPTFLEELSSLLAVEFEVVAVAADGKTALNLIHHYRPDLILSDLNMPVLNGMQLARELAKTPSGPPIVICSTETDPDIMEAAREAGVAEYVFKARIQTDLIVAAQSAIQNCASMRVAAERDSPSTACSLSPDR